MSRHFITAGGIAIVGQFALAAPAFALTPEEVWAQFEGFLEESGYAAEADVEPYEDGLIVNQITLSLASPDGANGQPLETVTTGAFTFLPDPSDPDSVAIAPVMPWAFEIQSSTPTGDITTNGTFSADGFSMTASGEPDDITYVSGGDQGTLTFTTTDASTGTEYATGTLTLNDMDSSTRIQQGDETIVTSGATLASLAIDATITPPEGMDDEQPVSISASVNGITLDSSSSMAGGEPVVTMADRVAAGMKASSTVLFESMQGQFAVEEEGDTVTLTLASDAGSIGSTLEDGLFGYDSTTKEIALGLTSQSIPMPILLSIASTSSALSGPVTPMDEDAPFSLHFDITDAALPDMAWAMIDPSNELPHDPVTISATLSGEGKLLVDLSDPMALSTMPAGQPPVEVDSLDIEDVTVQGLGAEITANGELDIETGTTSKFGDFPQVTGTINIAAEGVLGLVDTLSQAGVIPAQQAMMIPMFAGMFAQEVSGPDDLQTTIEITPDQSILINGTPMMP